MNSTAAMRREALTRAIRAGVGALSSPFERAILEGFASLSKSNGEMRLDPAVIVRILDAGRASARKRIYA
jgi:hypothetical protein